MSEQGRIIKFTSWERPAFIKYFAWFTEFQNCPKWTQITNSVHNMTANYLDDPLKISVEPGSQVPRPFPSLCPISSKHLFWTTQNRKHFATSKHNRRMTACIVIVHQYLNILITLWGFIYSWRKSLFWETPKSQCPWEGKLKDYYIALLDYHQIHQ